MLVRIPPIERNIFTALLFSLFNSLLHKVVCFLTDSKSQIIISLQFPGTAFGSYKSLRRSNTADFITVRERNA